MADTYVSFSKEQCLDSFTSFETFSDSYNNPDPFKIDQRDIEELRNKPITNPVEKPKKSKRNNSHANSTKPTGATPTVQCDICNVPISGPIVFDSHTKGKKHQTQLKNMLNKNPQYKAPTYEELCGKKDEPVVENNQIENTNANVSETNSSVSETNSSAKPTELPLIPTKKLNCNMCNISCNSQQMFDNHLTGKKHLTKLKQTNTTNPAPVRTVPDNNPSSSNYCDVCSLQLNSENELSEHLLQKQHQQRVKEAEFCAKEGAEMNINFDDYKISPTEPEKNSFEYQCTPCKKRFRNKIQLISHLKSAFHNRLINRTSSQNIPKESNQVKPQTKQENIPREKTEVHNHPQSYRRSNKPQGKSRPFRTKNFPRAQNFQYYDQDFNQSTSQNIFGAFDPNNEATFPPITTNNNDDNIYYSSHKRPRSYENNSNEYDGFYPKRNRSYDSGINTSQDYYSTESYSTESNYYPPSNSSSYPWDNNSYPSHVDDYNDQSSVPQPPWQYPTESSYDQQQYTDPSSAYMNPMHYPSNLPPLPNYEQPPLPNYPPPSSYSHSQNSAFLGSTGNPGSNSYYPNAFGQ